MVLSGIVSAALPKCFKAAAWVKVPTGPKNAMRCGASKSRHTDIISRNKRAIFSSAIGPSLRAITAFKTCASRSGR